jgi:orotidine-5'-phosphate decarboxylase
MLHGSRHHRAYLTFSRQAGKGVFVVLRTSNAGAGAFQDLAVGGTTVYGAIANALRPLTEAFCDGETGWSSLGVVVGATFPEEAVRIRAVLPKALFLLPGYGLPEGRCQADHGGTGTGSAQARRRSDQFVPRDPVPGRCRHRLLPCMEVGI